MNIELKTLDTKGLIAAVILLPTLIICVLSLVWTPYHPTHLVGDSFSNPSFDHWLGTDQYGRDIFSRLIVGTRTTIAVAMGGVAIGLLIGVPLGLYAGYSGGWADEILMRLNDVLLSIPVLLFALVILFVFGTNIVFTPIAIGIVFFPRIARVVRSRAIEIKGERFVDAAMLRGASKLSILKSEIFPNVVPTILVEGTFRLGYAIFIAAGLSFLGLGVQPPHPSLGVMTRTGRSLVFKAPGLLLYPGLVLFLLIFSFNLLGDFLADYTAVGEKAKWREEL